MPWPVQGAVAGCEGEPLMARTPKTTNKAKIKAAATRSKARQSKPAKAEEVLSPLKDVPAVKGGGQAAGGSGGKSRKTKGNVGTSGPAPEVKPVAEVAAKRGVAAEKPAKAVKNTKDIKALDEKKPAKALNDQPKAKAPAKSTAAAKKPAKPRAARKAAIVAPEVEPQPKPVKFQKHHVAIARRMFLAKVTDEDIAATFGIDVEELEWWKEEHPEFGACFRPDPKNYGGRPTTWDERNIAIAETLASLGATDLEIAQAFEVNIRTIHRWKLDYPEFRDALEVGKEAADAKVEDSLYKRATGYSFDSEKILVVEGEPQRVETIEHVPPDVKAAMWWLQNRKPGKWRDVRHIKHDVDEGSALGKWLDKLNGTTFVPQEDAPATEPNAFRPAEEDEG